MSMRRENRTVVTVTTPQVFHGPPHFTVGNLTAGDTTANCDYLDEGDGAQLRAALLAVNDSGGGTVFVRRGQYSIESAQALVIRSGTHLVGEGDATIIKASTTEFGDLINIQGKGCSLRDVRVQLDEGNPVLGTAACMIDAPSENVLVSNVSFSGVLDVPSTNRVSSMLLVASSDYQRNIQIDSCSFECETPTSQSVGDMCGSLIIDQINGMDADIPDTTTVTRCSFRDRGEGDKNHLGIAVMGGVAQIRDCIFERQGNYAVWISPKHSLVDGSSVEDCTVLVHDGKSTVQVYNHLDSSLPVAGVTIAGNTIRTVSGGSISTAAIRVFNDSPSHPIVDVSVLDNWVGGAVIGVWLEDSGGGHVENCLVDGNHLTNNTTPLEDAATGTVIGTNAT